MSHNTLKRREIFNWLCGSFMTHIRSWRVPSGRAELEDVGSQRMSLLIHASCLFQHANLFNPFYFSPPTSESCTQGSNPPWPSSMWASGPVDASLRTWCPLYKEVILLQANAVRPHCSQYCWAIAEPKECWIVTQIYGTHPGSNGAALASNGEGSGWGKAQRAIWSFGACQSGWGLSCRRKHKNIQ